MYMWLRMPGDLRKQEQLYVSQSVHFIAVLMSKKYC